MGRLIEILLLKALAMQKLGEPAQALALLTESLALAEPEGYIRVFVDEGSLMQTLLAHWLAHASASTLRDYAIHLLSHFDAEPQVVTAVQKKTSPTGDLVEPLSGRELEVLHLIATGRINKEIAQQLIVSLGTVKAHTASIFRKLGVANRTEAVAQARQLGILP
jgi:LuxR family maltose regulon positive regulatory protein